MTQSLWYLRSKDTLIGPYPAPQIKEMLAMGDISPEWEISLNEQDWLTIRESGQFDLSSFDRARLHAEEQQAWLAEREQARKRWQHGEGEPAAPLRHDPAQDEKVRQALSRDQAKTDELVRTTQTRRTSPLIAVLAVLALAGIGAVVWYGQQEQPIRPTIGLVANCAAPAAEGVNWNNCDKSAQNLANSRLRNASLQGVRLEDARLSGSDLSYAVLSHASLRNADLGGAALLAVDLTGADLSGANLSGADLRYAVFTGANMAGVRLDGARLDKAVWPDGRVCAEGAVGQCQ